MVADRPAMDCNRWRKCATIPQATNKIVATSHGEMVVVNSAKAGELRGNTISPHHRLT